MKNLSQDAKDFLIGATMFIVSVSVVFLIASTLFNK